MRLYVFRHGTTDWNEAWRLQGNSNTSLNDKGRDLARRTAKAIENIHFDYIFSSPLDRAYETACILKGSRDIEVVKDERLIEIGFGPDEGITPKERSEGCHWFFDDPAKYVPIEGAESIGHLKERTADFVYSVLVPLSKREPDATVMISGHGAMNKGLALTLCHRPIEKFWEGALQKNCSCAVYEINGDTFNLLEDGKKFFEI